MTLRARLTLAFLAVVLGPVLLSAVFVGTTATALNQSQARAGQLRVRRQDKAQSRLVLALVPQHVELRGDFLEIEGDAVRLVCLGGSLDQPRPTGELANQGDLGGVREPL